MVLKSLQNGRDSAENRVRKVVADVLESPELFEGLFECILHPDPTVRKLAADAVDLVSIDHPALLQPHKNTLIYKVAKVEQPEVRGHVANMLPRLRISPREYSTVIGILASYLEDLDHNVRIVALQALEALIESNSQPDNDNAQFRSDAMTLLQKVAKSNSLPSIKSDGTRLLKRLASTAAA